ncbi:MAG: PDZ domain-containing protein, partial [Planctomycetota bacterium]|nr:PDZ domain-containing protein [Planctomycetota bacterium]
VEDLRVADLKPEILTNQNNRNEKAIVFDKNTYRYFQGRNAKAIAETIKTQEAVDQASGKVIGLRIVGFDDEAPASAFDVRKGDILVSINGQRVTSRADAVRLAESLKEATLVTVVIDRRGQLVTYRVDPQDPLNRRKVRYFEGFGQ